MKAQFGAKLKKGEGGAELACASVSVEPLATGPASLYDVGTISIKFTVNKALLQLLDRVPHVVPACAQGMLVSAGSAFFCGLASHTT